MGAATYRKTGVMLAPPSDVGETTSVATPLELYARLRAYYGPQSWWPGDAAEIMYTAVLVQHSTWSAAARALMQLRVAELMPPRRSGGGASGGCAGVYPLVRWVSAQSAHPARSCRCDCAAGGRRRGGVPAATAGRTARATASGARHWLRDGGRRLPLCRAPPRVRAGRVYAPHCGAAGMDRRRRSRYPVPASNHDWAAGASVGVR